MQDTHNQNNNIPQYEITIAILFYLGEPVSFKRLASLLSVDVDTVEHMIPELKTRCEGTGLSIVVHDSQLQLVTSPEASLAIETIRKEEVTKDLSKASLETLSIILYQDNVSRADIDFIRGVNSSFILRNLLVRGLIVRKPHPTDSRTFVYTASHDLLSYLGVSSISELPDFSRVQTILKEKILHLEEQEGSDEEPKEHQEDAE